MSTPTPTETLTQWFQQLGLLSWFNLTPTQYFGQNGELGNDFGMDAGTSVAAAEAGKVVAVWQDPSGSSVGTIVQIEDRGGMLWHYQHLKAANVAVGQQVYPGTVIGFSGGCPTGGYDPSNPAICSRYDNYSTNPHIEVRLAPHYNPSGGIWNQGWIDPHPLFSQLGSFSLASQYGGLVGNAATAANNACVHSISWGSPSFFGQGGGTTTICMDPAIDFIARGTLVAVALVLVIMAVYIFTHRAATLGDAAQNAGQRVKQATDFAAMMSA